MAERDLFLIDPLNLTAALRPTLHGAGWRLHELKGPEMQQSRRPVPDAGIVVLDEPTLRQFRSAIEDGLSSHSDTQWVGLIDRCEGLEERGRRLIIEHLFDYHTLPWERRRLLETLGHAHGMGLLRRPSASGTDSPGASTCQMIGSSPPMRRVRHELLRMAEVDAPVVIRGEPGTGKALAARWLHQRSARHDRPFVHIACHAPEELLSRQLFGTAGEYERDTTTPSLAVDDGSTLFLEAVDKLPHAIRHRLSLALEPGGSSPLEIRTIATTTSEVLPADPIGRLPPLCLTLPPLRERSADIELLAEHYRSQFSVQYRRNKKFNEAALKVLNVHHWPGNIDELIRRVYRALVMSERRYLSASDLGLERRRFTRHLQTLEHARAKAEIEAIQASLQRNRRNVSVTARDLGISRVTLYRLMEKHGLMGRDTEAS